MKINFGCGKRYAEGFFNIDAQHLNGAKKPDLIYAMKFNPDGSLIEKIPKPDRCAKLVQSFHVIEHFYRWEADAVIQEFNRLLDIGGKLILECPNIELAANNLLKGAKPQLSYWGMYGNPEEKDPYMCHKWGYTRKSLKKLLHDNGFADIIFMKPQTHGRRINRDMRVECIKL